MKRQPSFSVQFGNGNDVTQSAINKSRSRFPPSKCSEIDHDDDK